MSTMSRMKQQAEIDLGCVSPIYATRYHALLLAGVKFVYAPRAARSRMAWWVDFDDRMPVWGPWAGLADAVDFADRHMQEKRGQHARHT